MGDAFIVACARGAAEEVQQFLTDGVDPDTVHSTVGAWGTVLRYSLIWTC